VLLLQLSPPDAQGRLSLGISVDVIRAALASARLVIAEINPRMPRTCGDTAVLPDQIDHVLEVDAPLATVALGAGDPAGDAIADNIAGLIRDGDVIQTGIGAIPDLMALRLGHCRNLGLHTGIITEAVRPLIDGGVITNPQGAFPGRSVATLAAGSASFYDFLHGNTAVAFHPCSLTHDRRLLAGIPQFCAVNGALEIDLAGRVNAERVDGRPVSAPGGQPDFAFGGARAAGGKSIVALRATSKDGTVSRIVPALAPGVAATITARDITHVATEHGVARIAGLSGSALRDALVGIAAPAFRAALRQAPG
jgi:4-hydroxybutyrate CoA-transferase